jgi:hypothetical protein
MLNRPLRSALILGLSVLGWITPPPEIAEAAHAVRDAYWDRRPLPYGYGGCRVPYQIETDTSQVYNTVMDVIRYINAVTPCVWEPRQPWESDYVAITENDFNILWFTDLAANAGGIGRNGGRQEMKICHGCNDFDLIAHEMGHSMGFLHEHQRPDRDSYIDVNRAIVQNSAQGAFDVNPYGTTLGLPYDVRSVMHYDGFSFIDPLAYPFCAVTGCRTVSIKGYPQGELGSTYFTDTDLRAFNRRYPFPNRIVAMHSGRCVDIPGGNGSEGTAVEQYDCHDGYNQGWLMRWWDNDGATDFYLIESADPASAGMCLDVQWASQNPGAPVILYPCHGGHSQQWSLQNPNPLITGNFVRARHSNQCLDVAGGNPENNGGVVQNACSGAESQIWGRNGRPQKLVREPPDPRCGNPRDPC